MTVWAVLLRASEILEIVFMKKEDELTRNKREIGSRYKVKEKLCFKI